MLLTRPGSHGQKACYERTLRPEPGRLVGRKEEPGRSKPVRVADRRGICQRRGSGQPRRRVSLGL